MVTIAEKMALLDDILCRWTRRCTFLAQDDTKEYPVFPGLKFPGTVPLLRGVPTGLPSGAGSQLSWISRVGFFLRFRLICDLYSDNEFLRLKMRLPKVSNRMARHHPEWNLFSYTLLDGHQVQAQHILVTASHYRNRAPVTVDQTSTAQLYIQIEHKRGLYLASPRGSR